ncbi:MAG TPA: hypothetical protein VK497_02120 [Candidatus Saccharimonadales bacterium]|nr:hypothetical protein [Candidatus Saccharimonadales bacterium]
MKSREGFPYGPAIISGIEPIVNPHDQLDALKIDHEVVTWLWSALGDVMNINQNHPDPHHIYEGVESLSSSQVFNLREELLMARKPDLEKGIFQSEIPLDLLHLATTHLLATDSTESNRRKSENYIESRLSYLSDSSRRDEVLKNSLAHRALAIDASQVIQSYLQQEPV